LNAPTQLSEGEANEYHWTESQLRPEAHEMAELVELLGEFEEAKHPRADDGKFGSGSGSTKGPASHTGKVDPQEHFDSQAKAADAVAKSSGRLADVQNFLNVDRVRVSQDERAGRPNATSDGVTAFLKEAHAKGADYKGPVYRGTTQSELDNLLAHKSTTTTISVSKDPDGSAKFAKKGGVLIVMKRGMGAVPVDGIEGSNTFNEALLPKGTKVKVVSQREKNGVKIVELERDDSAPN
jgi:hypothetical protein